MAENDSPLRRASKCDEIRKTVMKSHRPTTRRPRRQRRAEDAPPVDQAAHSLDVLRQPVHGATHEAAVAELQRTLGNAAVERVLAKEVVQRQGGRRGGGATGGAGAGQIQHATERPYNVSGATLDDLRGQLERFGGFGAETNAPLGMSGRVRPTRLPDGTFRAQVRWVISGATVHLPRWVDYGAACAAAQHEWDRFLQQTRVHEQQTHVDAARNFVQQLGEDDTVITGTSVAELQSNLEAKQQDLAARLQAIHDSCGHGADIDAVLHPEHGQCE